MAVPTYNASPPVYYYQMPAPPLINNTPQRIVNQQNPEL